MTVTLGGKLDSEYLMNRFNRRYALLTFLGLTFFFSSYIFPLYILSGQANNATLSYNTYYQMAVEKNTLEFKGNLIQDGMRAGNITLQEGMAALGAIVSKGKALEVEYASLQETDNKAWSYCLIGFVITFFLNCFPLGFIFWYRNHRYVRNRGTYFIFHLISAILLYYISSFLYHGTLTLRYDFLNKSERQRIVISELLSKLHLFFLFACFGAIVCRSRVVYQAFDVQSNTKPSKWSYFHLFPLVFLLWFIPSIPSFLKIYGLYHGTTRVIFYLPSFLILVFLTAYYTLRCRSFKNHRLIVRYCDFYLNFTIIFINTLILIPCVIVLVFDDSPFVAYAIYYANFLLFSVYVSYPVFPLVYLMRKRIHISTERSENKFTRQTSEFGHIVCQQEQENSSTLHMEGNSNSYREKGGKEFTNETDLKIEASIAEMHDL